MRISDWSSDVCSSVLLACVSCHNLAEGGDDGLPLPGRAEGRSGEVNTPTIFNSVLSFRLGWRGTYRRLADQVDADIEDPRLMHTSWTEVLGKLRADSGYLAAFARTYGNGITRENVLDALSRSEERRVGTERVRKCRTRWVP